MQAKNEKGSVKEYRAKGDGVTDDTQAIQAALNAVAEGGVLVLEPGAVYRVTAISLNI